MIVTAVVCPPAPLLVPGLAVGLAGVAAEFCAACERAVGALRGVAHVTILAAGPGGAAAGPGDAVTAGFGRSDRSPFAPARLAGGPVVADGGSATSGEEPPGRDRSPVRRVAAGTAVAASLLQRCGVTAPACAVEVSDPSEGTDVSEGAEGSEGSEGSVGSVGSEAMRVAGTQVRSPSASGLLVMADGAACHGEHAPGAPDARSEPFDAEIVTALRSGDPAALAATCTALAPLVGPLRAESFPALAAMAALVADLGPARAEVLHYSAPFGVGYPVAVWRWGRGDGAAPVP